MQQLFFGAAACIFVAGGVFLYEGGMPAKTYAMSVAEANAKLASAPTRDGQMPFGDQDIRISRPTQNIVQWDAKGSHSAVSCSAKIEPASEGRVTVTKSCVGGAGPSDGAAAGATGDMVKIAFAEFVDSSLENRPFNDSVVNAAKMAAMASNMPSMIGGAIKMDIEMQKMQIEEEKRRKNGASSASQSSSSFGSSSYSRPYNSNSYTAPTTMGQPTSNFGDPTTPTK
jgi:hypothetical protein